MKRYRMIGAQRGRESAPGVQNEIDMGGKARNVIDLIEDVAFGGRRTVSELVYQKISSGAW